MQAPARLACILAHNLPVQIEYARRGRIEAILIPHPVHGETIFAASDDLLLTGVEIGMTVYQAQQIAPHAIVIQPNEGDYHARHDAIREALKNFTILIETAALGRFFIDVRELGQLHGGEQQLAAAIHEALRDPNAISVHVGIAAGKFIALQAARRAGGSSICVVPAGEEGRFVSTLPISALPDLPREMRRRLIQLDLHTLGDLAALRKAAVVRQFEGGEAARLYELARGRDPSPLQPDLPPLRIIRAMAFNEPVADWRQLVNAVQHLSQRLGRALSLRGYQAEAIKVVIETGRTGPVRLEHGLALKPPTADEQRLARAAALILDQFAVIKLVSRIAVSAYPLRSWHHGAHQLALLSVGVSDKQVRLEETIQLILRRFGDRAIQTAALVGPPIPVPVKVQLNRAGLPAVISLGGRIHGVANWDERWREERGWWASKPIRRDYYRVMFHDESIRIIFKNTLDNNWYLDRAWPIL